MVAISRGQGRLRSNLQTRCPLPLAISLPSFDEVTRIHLEESAKVLLSDPKNVRHFPRSRWFEVLFADKVPLTPSYIPAKFRRSNQNRLGEKCKSVIF